MRSCLKVVGSSFEARIRFTATAAPPSRRAARKTVPKPPEPRMWSLSRMYSMLKRSIELFCKEPWRSRAFSGLPAFTEPSDSSCEAALGPASSRSEGSLKETSSMSPSPSTFNSFQSLHSCGFA